MRYPRSAWQTIRILFMAISGWVILSGHAVSAEEGGGGGSGGSGSWALPYMVVMFCLALGMLTVCLSQRRRDRGKSEYSDRKRPMQIDLE